jgi:hypothetical protein
LKKILAFLKFWKAAPLPQKIRCSRLDRNSSCSRLNKNCIWKLMHKCDDVFIIKQLFIVAIFLCKYLLWIYFFIMKIFLSFFTVSIRGDELFHNFFSTLTRINRNEWKMHSLMQMRNCLRRKGRNCRMKKRWYHKAHKSTMQTMFHKKIVSMTAAITSFLNSKLLNYST